MRIALVQFCSDLGQVEQNTEKMCGLIAQAARGGAELVVFPEMSDTGYHPSVFTSSAQPWPGPVFNALQLAAKTHSTAVACGISEKVGEQIFNSLAVFSNSGDLVSSYRKTHLFCPAPVFEDRYFSAGEILQVADIGSVRLGLSICYDLRFPELYRCLAQSGASVLINVAAWPRKRSTHWDWLTRARAIENQLFFVAVSSVGGQEAQTLNGNSRVLSPRGEVIGALADEKDAILIVDVDLGEIEAFRQELPLELSRRPDLYVPLASREQD